MRRECAAGTRETREGWWPLLTVETKVNGDSKSTNERGPSLVSSLGMSCRYKRFCFALTALVGQIQHVFSPPYTISIPLSQSLTKLGKQPCWVACILICVSVGTVLLLMMYGRWGSLYFVHNTESS